jgi:hypothetical protein
MRLRSQQRHEERMQAVLPQRVASGHATAANVVADGVPPLSFLTMNAGRVSVLNLTTGTKIHTADIPDAPMGALVAVNPEKKAITLGSTDTPEFMVLASPIDPTHRFQITFDPATPATRPTAGEVTN